MPDPPAEHADHAVEGPPSRGAWVDNNQRRGSPTCCRRSGEAYRTVSRAGEHQCVISFPRPPPWSPVPGPQRPFRAGKLTVTYQRMRPSIPGRRAAGHPCPITGGVGVPFEIRPPDIGVARHHPDAISRDTRARRQPLSARRPSLREELCGLRLPANRTKAPPPRPDPGWLDASGTPASAAVGPVTRVVMMRSPPFLPAARAARSGRRAPGRKSRAPPLPAE